LSVYLGGVGGSEGCCLVALDLKKREEREAIIWKGLLGSSEGGRPLLFWGEGTPRWGSKCWRRGGGNSLLECGDIMYLMIEGGGEPTGGKTYLRPFL